MLLRSFQKLVFKYYIFVKFLFKFVLMPEVLLSFWENALAINLVLGYSTTGWLNQIYKIIQCINCIYLEFCKHQINV